MFVNRAFSFDHIFSMHEALDLREYDEEVANQKSIEENKKNNLNSKKKR